MRLAIRIRSDSRAGFIAVCPSLPGCMSSGQTEQQARKNLAEAIRGYLASVNDFVPRQIEVELEYQYQA